MLAIFLNIFCKDKFIKHLFKDFTNNFTMKKQLSEEAEIILDALFQSNDGKCGILLLEPWLTKYRFEKAVDELVNSGYIIIVDHPFNSTQGKVIRAVGNKYPSTFFQYLFKLEELNNSNSKEEFLRKKEISYVLQVAK